MPLSIPRIMAACALLMMALACGEAEKTPAPQSATPGSGEEGIRIFMDPIGKAGLINRTLIQEFTQSTGIPVSIIGSPGNSLDMFGKVNQILASRNNEVDVVMVDVIWPPMLHEYLEDLAPLMQNEAAEFFPELIRHNTVQGRLVGVPFYVDMGLLYYRADLLEKYGYKAPPSTWDELEEMSTRIQKGERAAGNAAFWGMLLSAEPTESLTCIALEWQASHGGGNIVNESGTVTLNNALTLAAMERARGWIGSIVPKECLTYDIEEARKEFQTGNAAFFRSWCYAWEMMNDSSSGIAGRVGVAAVPAGPTGPRTVLGGWQLGISRASRNKDDAWRLVRFLTSEASQRRRALMGGFPPTRSAVYRVPELLEKQPHFPLIEQSIPNLVARPSRGSRLAYSQISAIYMGGVHEVLSGTTGTGDALASMQSAMETALED